MESKPIATPQEICDLIDDVDETNPHFEDCQKIKFDLLMMQDEAQQNKEELFVTSFNSGDQAFAKKIFYELCGIPFGEGEAMGDIKPNMETLLMLAKKLREKKRCSS